MNYPKVQIDLKKLKHNVETIVKLCKEKGIEVAGVTKVFCGNPEIAKVYIDGGVSYLADSRIENLIKLMEFNVPKILLRLPMISEADKVVEYTDISLNSELKTIKELSIVASEKGKKHKIILMVDLGDLREGYFYEDEIYEVVEEILNLKGVELLGIGTNLTCYGGVIPSQKNLGKLVKIGKNIEERFNIKPSIISGGNSSSLHLLLNDVKIQGINMLRLGESLVLGLETAYGNRIQDTYDDVFQLVAEIIEVKEKPSLPVGEIGKNAFGKIPRFEDKGIRKRMIVALGKQDIDFDTIVPEDSKVAILGGSSDHLILDGTDSEVDYKVGDKIKFKLSYGGILRAMTSEYIKKELI
ncbi:ornithine racemase Orr [Tepidimicrobium xylanilyticum]|uniref:Predicted amino acid racemase n=1 Tax=Tepidimicrobium xylanilyticum TaxID=1123352 RepID=A0A1H2SMS2_9FIRM|nr:ornithine racemase Orr [Tepidimicrobium xylanilyticum]GMG96169.1 alanine racemase [Tepidimicrobium xylanilyticum]SDW32900.1 Predicted amino acid racemase [Tepidimicrobium xylanilyticum]